MFKFLLFLFGCILIWFYVHSSSSSCESYKGKEDQEEEEPPKRKRKLVHIGDAKMVRTASLVIAFPSIVPLRVQTKVWPAKVPLTPFKAPYLKLPELKKGESLPNFLLYDPEYLTPIRNQGDCGSCWAFALLDTLSDRVVVQTAGLFRENLSVQQMLQCFNPKGCDGESPENGALWLGKNQFALTTESKQPYRSGKGEVKGTCTPSSVKSPRVTVRPEEVYSLVEFVSETGYDKKKLEDNIHNMKLELYQGGPFYCAMAVYEDLFRYAGTRPYKRDAGTNIVGGHAIQIIGYCDKGVDPRKGYSDGYWFCRNSWGEDWPTETTMSGYFTIQMGVNMCGIESRCGVAIPQLLGEKYLLRRKPKTLKELRYERYSDYYG